MVLSSERMQKVRIIVLAKDKEKVIRFLHEREVIDLRKSELGLQDDAPFQRLAALSDLLIKVNGAISILKRPKKLMVRKRPALEGEQLISKIKGTLYIDSIFKINEKIRELNEDIKALENALDVATMFDGISVDFSNLKSERLAFKAFVITKKHAKDARDAIARKKIREEIISEDINAKEQLFFIAYQKGAPIDEVIDRFGAKELDLGAKYLSGAPKEIQKLARERIAADKKSLLLLHAKIREIEGEDYLELLAYREMLEIELERAAVPAEFKKTDNTVILEGWVPEKGYSGLHESLFHFTKNRCFIERIAAKELPPTMPTRPKWLRSFDYLMDFFSTPKSTELDPTWIFILSFPVFYGLMVSDVGYGVVSFLLATWLTTFTDPEGLVYNTAKIWQITAVSAVFFGVITDQYFGLQLGGIFASVKLFDWIKNITSILVLTVFFGILQVAVGLAFGFINKYRERKFKLAVSKITSIIAVVAGVFAVGGYFFNIVSPGIALISAATTVAAFILSGVLSGIEATELTNLITHPLSYTRILGFGLASVIIAFLIDSAFTPTLSNGIFVFIGLLFVFITLHLLNMILAIFEGIVQGVRLNFVEFFSKFYEGGGVKFRPFAYKKKYIE